MSATEFSLLAVTLGFLALLVWVYSPSRKNRLESYGGMPLDDHDNDNRGDGERK